MAAAAQGGSKRKHLVTEQGFGWRYGLSLVVIGGAVAAAQRSIGATIVITELYDELQWGLMDLANDWSMVIAMGMLSSSCCLVQVLLSALSFGCAGFNTWLGPLRPPMLALSTAAQLYNWSYVLGRGWRLRGAVASSAATATLALLPEIIEFWARRKLRLAAAATAASASASVSASDPDEGEALAFRLGGMGCVSCVKAVSDTLSSSGLVARHELNFEAEHLRVWLPPAADPAAVSGRIVEALAGAGFEAGRIGGGSGGGGCCNAVEPETKDGTGGRNDASCGIADDCKPCGDKAADGDDDNDDDGDGDGDDDDNVAMSWISFVTAGLLASSCCLLQLGLNGAAMLGLLNVGCVGFNKTLGPHRTELRWATSAWLAGLWLYTAAVRPKASRFKGLVARTAMCGLLVFLPELLQAGMASGQATALDAIGAERVTLDVTGMGCEACELYVKGVLDAADGVIDSAVSYKDGTAELIVGKGFAFNITQTLVQLAHDGYAAALPPVPCERIWASNATGGMM